MSALGLRCPAAPQLGKADPLAPPAPRRLGLPAAPAAAGRGGAPPAAARRSAPAVPAPDLLYSSDVLSDSELVSAARQRLRARQPAGGRASPSSAAAAAAAAADGDFLAKVVAAWRIFFPERARPLSAKEEGKKRLRMILVADRCGMDGDSLRGMKNSIVEAMKDYVEVEADEAVEVNMSMDPDLGTIYSVAVPVRRVKPQLRPAPEGGDAPAAAAYDPADPDSSPADQFPYGT